jgi:hypothetical protein
MWSAAAEMAQRQGLHCTTKVLRMDYTRLKKRLPAEPLHRHLTQSACVPARAALQTGRDPHHFTDVFDHHRGGDGYAVYDDVPALSNTASSFPDYG